MATNVFPAISTITGKVHPTSSMIMMIPSIQVIISGLTTLDGLNLKTSFPEVLKTIVQKLGLNSLYDSEIHNKRTILTYKSSASSNKRLFPKIRKNAHIASKYCPLIKNC